MILDEMLRLAEETAQRAGDHALAGQSKARAHLKSADQIVTQLDLECQNIIIGRIRERFPDHGFIAEEGPEGSLLHQSPTGPDDIWWVIDPIDGTRNYAHGLPLYAVSVAAMQNGRPVVGAIYDPNVQMMFSAQSGMPGRCNGKKIRCIDQTLDTNSQLAVSSNLYAQIPHCVFEIMEKYVYVNLGSAALHYGYVASGAFAGAISWNVKLWDIAAGAVICQEAGAVVSDLAGQSRFPVDCGAYRGDSVPVLIAAESIQVQLQEIISRG